MARPKKPRSRTDDEDDDDPAGPAGPVETDFAEHWPTITQCEADTGIPASTLRRWCKEEKLRSVLRQGSYRIDPAAAIELGAQEDRINAVESTGALVRQEFQQTQGKDLAARVDHTMQAGLLSASADVLRQTREHAKDADSQTVEAFRLVLLWGKQTQAGQAETLVWLKDLNKSLAAENASLRADLKEYWESLKTDKIKTKELEIKAEATREGLAIGKLLAPQILAFAMGKAFPTDPDASDRGIKAVLESLSQEQAIELHTKKLITDAQASEALRFRMAGTVQKGELTRWMQTFTSEQIGMIVASGVLKKEQSLALTAAHEASSKIQMQAPSLAASSTPAANSSPSTTTTTTTTPASSIPSTTTTPASSTPSTPANTRLFLQEEVEVISAFFAVILDAADVEISNKGDKTSLLTFVLEKLGPLAPRLKTIRWDRTP